MAVQYATLQQKLDAANALAKAEALLRRAVQEGPVNYAADVGTAVANATTKLAAITAATGV